MLEEYQSVHYLHQPHRLHHHLLGHILQKRKEILTRSSCHMLDEPLRQYIFRLAANFIKMVLLLNGLLQVPSILTGGIAISEDIHILSQDSIKVAQITLRSEERL